MFCNICNGVGCIENSIESRTKWCRVKQACSFLALILGIVGACGLSSDAGTMKNTYWCVLPAARSSHVLVN